MITQDLVSEAKQGKHYLRSEVACNGLHFGVLLWARFIWESYKPAREKCSTFAVPDSICPFLQGALEHNGLELALLLARSEGLRCCRALV